MKIAVLFRILVHGACLYVLTEATSGTSRNNADIFISQNYLRNCKTYSEALGLVEDAYKDLHSLQSAVTSNDIESIRNNIRLHTRAKQWIQKLQSLLVRTTELCNLTQLLEHTSEEHDKGGDMNSIKSKPRSRSQSMKGNFLAVEAINTRTPLQRKHKRLMDVVASQLLSMVSRSREAVLPEKEAQALLLKILRLVQRLEPRTRHLLNTGSWERGSVEKKLETDSVKEERSGVEIVVEVGVEEAVREVPPTFLSVTLGPRLMKRHWEHFNTSSPLVQTLTGALAPAVLRMGGSAANFVTYDPTTLDTFQSPEDLNREGKGATSSISRGVLESLEVPQDQQPVTPPPQSKSTIFREHRHTGDETSDSLLNFTDLTMDTSNLTNNETPDELQSNPQDGPLLGEGRTQVTQRYPGSDCECSCESDYDDKTLTNFTITSEDWEMLTDFVEVVGMQLLFDVNQFYRGEDGVWEPSNARLLMRDAAARGADILWQLGNEPNSYNHNYGFRITGEQAAQDFGRMQQELTHYFPTDQGGSPVVGPDVTRPKQHKCDQAFDGLGTSSVEYLKEFLSSVQFNLTAVSWHQYYEDGRTATVWDFLSPDMMDLLVWQVAEVVAVRDQMAPDTPIWMTETGSCFGGGAPNISDAYAAGFLWMDKLGVAALGGVDLVARQTLYDGSYALINKYLVPYPDYWLSVLYKRLVGGRVLNVSVSPAPRTIRLYAHCHNQRSAPGGVVLYGMNLGNETIQVTLAQHLAGSLILQYLLVPPDGDLQSREVLLNGQLLQMSPDGNLPEMIPQPLPNGVFLLPPTSFGFWVLPDAHAPACM